MYWDDHSPPHFHAKYAGYEASFAIATGDVLKRVLPVRATRLVRQWLALHREELGANWDRARAGIALVQIDPLP